MKNNKGILVVSFGTSYLDTLEKNIAMIEKMIAQKYPAYQVYRAFTSQMILNKLRDHDNLVFWNVKEAMEQMLRDGIEEIIVQPTHIIPGIENDKMLRVVQEYQSQFRLVQVGNPLLQTDQDYQCAADIVARAMTLDSQEALILMGHGTTHQADDTYRKLQDVFHKMGHTQVYVGTVEGAIRIEDVIAQMKNQDYRIVKLLPFMLVAGDHATNDMAGKEDSWKSILQKSGYDVETYIQGLGELSGIREMFLKHLQNANSVNKVE